MQRSAYIIVSLLGLLAGVLSVRAQIDPDFMRPCERFPGDFSPALSQPWKRPGLPCLESVIEDRDAGEWAFTSMTTAPDGTLFVTRPLTGEVFALDDTDGEGLPDTPRLIVSGLEFPNGLAYRDDVLFILTQGSIIRFDLVSGEQAAIAGNLPLGGLMTGGLTLGDDDRLYFTTGAACDDCSAADRGTVSSVALDGSDLQSLAVGLRHPFDLAYYQGVLWVGDRAQEAHYAQADLDELNRIDLSAAIQPIDFGFPACIGDRVAFLPNVDCLLTSAPVLGLPTHSSPMGIAAYTSDAIPELTGKLLILLAGTEQRLELRGYALLAFDPRTRSLETLIPANPALDDPRFQFTTEEINYRGAGFFPYRPIDVTVSQQGVIYISGGARIISLRPFVPSARDASTEGGS